MNLILNHRNEQNFEDKNKQNHMNVQVITKRYVWILVTNQSKLDTIAIISYINGNLDQIKLILVHV